MLSYESVKYIMQKSVCFMFPLYLFFCCCWLFFFGVYTYTHDIHSIHHKTQNCVPFLVVHKQETNQNGPPYRGSIRGPRVEVLIFIICNVNVVSIISIIETILTL